MFKKFTDGCVSLVNRFLPDPYIFCIVLTIIVFIGAIPATGASPLDIIIKGWAGGVWALLGFSMQMVLVLVLGDAFANAPAIKRVIRTIAKAASSSPKKAIFMTAFISTIACWVNWGFGLVVGAILAKEIARQCQGVDYRLLIASAYSGFVVWHAGFSGSIPLAVATATTDAGQWAVGDYVADVIPITETIFSWWNILMCVLVLIIMPAVLAKIHPGPDEVHLVDPGLLEEREIKVARPETPAEKMEQSAILSYIIVIAGIIYMVWFFINKGINVDLNTVNFIFLILGILFHKTPINYVKAIENACKGAAGIILQFPFYAGIMGIMTFKLAEGGTGESLAIVISDFFVQISTIRTYPLFSFLASGFLNFFIPSGGGQWTVQGSIMMPAGDAIGTNPAVTAMSVAWGDSWTNMIQPFWALPALGIAGLSARDIMGYCVITLIVSGIIVGGLFLLLGFIL
ncbi:MAG: short-chain fatty acid transporter [Firmicutes bacterium]|nr:short-chain fatty acid transporter [Bacillota bacterium]MBR3183093.1 short-chain fatty acid transporter [Bacillota bacterium]MBR3260200.1 short-chain fatty acid transporter [Bacillota bacterium]MBR3374446.1 short-chain fatty acid transporter [Bacillota bacterium]MBR4023912.1 short-chain fatty acid transporter [Bacillota bacterium]